jgi:hypothetical protein
MKRFTLFTLLYIAAGVYFTVVALQHPNITPNLKTTLLFNAGFSYLVAVLSTFPFWRRGRLKRQVKPPDEAAWHQIFVIIPPYLVIVLTLVTAIPDLLNHKWSIDAIARASIGLLLILLSAEQIFIRSQTRQ